MKSSSAPLMPIYHQLPVAFERGEGVWLWDSEGRKYLDALSGYAVCALGHSHPEVTKTIIEQAKKLIHTCNIVRIPAQEKLAQKLVELSGMDQVIFSNSGAETIETAIKLTRLYAQKKEIRDPIIITCKGGFHGHTMGATSASGIERVKKGFEPLLPYFINVDFNHTEIIEDLIHSNSNIIAVMLEPIQGDGGIRIPACDYLNKIRSICDENKILMILDEIQTGIGRTGEWFAYQHNNILPDIVTISKSLGNGIPIGACLVKDKLCDLFESGTHGGTFSGNPLSCETALTVLRVIEDQKLLHHIYQQGQNLLNLLRNKFNKYKEIIDIRGKGLMIGFELNQPCKDLNLIGVKHGIIFHVVSSCVIRLQPPYIISNSEIEELVDRLDKCLSEFLS